MHDLAVLEDVERVRGVVGQQPRRVQLGQRVGERERDALVLGDRRAERFALLRPLGGEIDEPKCSAAAPSRDEEALDENPFLRPCVSACRHTVRIRHAAVAEHDLGVVVDVRVVEERRRAHDLHARRPRIDEEERLLPGRHCEDDVDTGLAFARDEPLLAVQHPLVTVTHRGRGKAGEIGACTRLRERPRLPILAVCDRAHVALDLIVRGDLVELARAAIDDCEPEPVRGLPRLLLERDLPDHGEIAASELGRHVQHREARVARLPAERRQLGGLDRTALGDAGLERIDLGLDETPDRFLERAEILWQLWNDHRAAA